MATSGAQPGNRNAKRGTAWRDAVRKAIAQDKGSLDRLARRLIALAEGGDLAALKEIGDRLDGKAAQSHELSGPDGGPIRTMTLDELYGRIGKSSDTESGA